MRLTQERLKSLLHYDPCTGVFTWLDRRSIRVAAGHIAGGIHPHGYIHIGINKRQYGAHRLAFLYMTGEMPVNQVDHINGVRDDNKWANLRHATHSINSKNRRKDKTNKSGVTGVHWNKRDERWQSNIRINWELLFLGYFTDWFEAVCARKSAETKYGFHINHGRA